MRTNAILAAAMLCAGGSAVVAVNHLGLGWNTPAVKQITAWLGAP